MSKEALASNSLYCLLPTEVEGFGPLAELALDMRWSWNHYADEVWRQLDPALWELTQNPWVVLQTVSRDRLRHVLADPVFRQKVDALVEAQTSGGGDAGVVPAGPPAIALELRRLFQHGIHAERGAADLFGRPGQRGRRPAQGGQRSRGAGGRRRTALPAGLFPPGDRQGRRPAGALPLQRSRPAADHARCASRTANGCGWRSTCPATRSGCAPGRSRWAGSSCTCWTATTRPTSRRIAASPASFTAAARSCACSRSWCSASAAGGCSRPGHPAGGLPPQRRARRLRGPGARPHFHAGDRAAVRRCAGRHARRQPLHHPHRGRRRLRPFRPGADRAIPGRLCRRRLGISLDDLLALGRGNPDDARRASTWPIWRSAAAARSTASAGCTGKSAGSILSRCFRAGPRTKCRSATSPTASTCRPGTRRRPTSSGRRPAARIAGSGRRKRWSRTSAAFPTRSSGSCAPPPESRSSTTRASDLPGSWPAPARPPKRSRRRSICSIPTS